MLFLLWLLIQHLLFTVFNFFALIFFFILIIITNLKICIYLLTFHFVAAFSYAFAFG